MFAEKMQFASRIQASEQAVETVIKEGMVMVAWE